MAPGGRRRGRFSGGTRFPDTIRIGRRFRRRSPSACSETREKKVGQGRRRRLRGERGRVEGAEGGACRLLFAISRSVPTASAEGPHRRGGTQRCVYPRAALRRRPPTRSGPRRPPSAGAEKAAKNRTALGRSSSTRGCSCPRSRRQKRSRSPPRRHACRRAAGMCRAPLERSCRGGRFEYRRAYPRRTRHAVGVDRRRESTALRAVLVGARVPSFRAAGGQKGSRSPPCRHLCGHAARMCRAPLESTVGKPRRSF